MKQKRVVLKTMPRKGKIIGTISALLVLITYILPIIEVRVLDTLINGFGKESARFFLLMVVMLSLIYGFYYVYEPLTRYLQNRMRIQVRQSMQASFAEKLAYLSMETLEKPEHQTVLNRLKEGGEQCVVSAFFAVLSMVGSAVSIAGIFSFVAQADLRYVFFLAGMLAAMLAVCVYVGKSRVAFSRIRQESSRRSEYLRGILFEKRLAQEKKLFGYTEYIHSLYKEEDDRSVKSMRKGMFRVESVVWIYENITYLFAASSYFLLLFPLFEKKISIGLYVALMPALTKIGNFAVRTVKEYVPALWQYHAYAEDLKQLQTMEEQQAVPAGKRQIKQFQTIEFQDVTFFYPNKKEAVLNQFCLKIEQGKSYAVVGENGCGKTTMVKLLLGLYQPFEGTIKIDGVDISQLPFEELQSYFSAIFQDFNRYEDSVQTNIGISDLEHMEDKCAIQDAARASDIGDYVEGLPDGYETVLGTLKENGSELSLGQWQKIAIARLLFRKASIYIWDEPTASMDPLSESKLYTYYQQQMAKKCTNIFITHRLGAATMADVICVLDHGRVVELGSHSQLTQKKDGLYAKMFEAQRGMYL